MNLRFLLRAGALFSASVMSATPSQAVELSGLWATSAGVCDKLFEKTGNDVSFRQDSDIYGSGLIIEGDRIRSQSAACRIRSRREDGAVVHFLAACSTDIMLSSVQFSLKIIDQDTISRIFPGLPGEEIGYYRCSL